MRTPMRCLRAHRRLEGVSWASLCQYRRELERRPLGALRPIRVHPDGTFDIL